MGDLMSLGFDPEVPAGYQDADIEMRELAEAADDMRHEVGRRLAQLGIQASVGDPEWIDMESIVSEEWWG